MNNNKGKLARRIKTIFTGALLALSFAGAGYAVQPGSARAAERNEQQLESTTASDGSDLQSSAYGGSCCYYGDYTCPTNGNIVWDYDVPGCGPITRPTAASRCKAQCGRACVDSGWLSMCQ